MSKKKIEKKGIERASVTKKETELLLKRTIVGKVDLPEQTFDERIKEIEKLARVNGLKEETLTFEWGADEASLSKKNKIAPDLKYENISLEDLLIYSTDNRSLHFTVDAGKVILLDISAER